MAFCTECGTNVPDDVKFCTACGKPMGAAPQTEPVMAGASPPAASQPQSASAYVSRPGQAPVYIQQPGQTPVTAGIPVVAGDAAPSKGSKYEPITTGGYIGIMLLMCIPIVGQILTIVWAFGGCRKINKRNLARAMLVFLVISIVLSVILFFIGRWVMDAATSYMSEATGSPDGLAGLLELLGGLEN